MHAFLRFGMRAVGAWAGATCWCSTPRWLCPYPVQYPAENAYQEFLSQHGGTSNAFTAADRACYFFDVSHQYLRGALDRCVCCACVVRVLCVCCVYMGYGMSLEIVDI